jgi:hypothetical protein
MTHTIDPWVMWHARIMVLAWAVFLPLGAIAARYYKVTPKQNWPTQLDNRAWWHAHRGFQYGGLALMLVGVALAWNAGGARNTAAAFWHAYLGWTVIVLGLFQVISAWLRGTKGGPTEPELRGDHYDMTEHRKWFERLHKTCGWLALGLGVIGIGLGLVAVDAPRWMPLLLGLWWLGLVVLALRLERAGRCVDTYQAIWGPDPKHPGNQPGRNMRHSRQVEEKL